MITYKQFSEEQTSFSTKHYDVDGFPKVHEDFKQYSSASRDTLKGLCDDYKLDNRGTKKQLINRILTKFHGAKKLSGYYQRTADTKFKYIRKGENTAIAPRSYEKKTDKE